MGIEGQEKPLLTSSIYADWSTHIVDQLINKRVDEFVVKGNPVATGIDRKKKGIGTKILPRRLEMLPYLGGVSVDEKV
jgi:hypothetical protein